MKRTIMITGAGGYVGSYLVRYFSQQGYSVIAVSRSALNESLCALPGVQTCLADQDYGFDISGHVESVIHTAALSRPNCATTVEYLRANGLVTASVADWAIQAKVRTFLYLSSLSIYGQITTSVVDENTDRRNPCAYGISKYLGECVLKDVADALPSVSLRLPGIIGPKAQGPWLARVMDMAIAHQTISMTNRNALFNNLIHVADLAAFCQSILETQTLQKAHALTLAAADPVSVQELVETIIAATGSRSQIQDKGPQGVPFTISTQRAEQEFSYRPRSVRDIVYSYAQDVLDQA